MAYDNYTEGEAGDVVCPECGHNFLVEDSFEYGVGSDFECPGCGTELAVSETETRAYWTVSTMRRYCEDEEREKERAVKRAAEHKKLIAKWDAERKAKVG